MPLSVLRSALLCFLPAMAMWTFNATQPVAPHDDNAPETKDPAIQVQFLEFVTPDVEAMCGTLEKLHGVEFSAPVPEFGNARTAALGSGGLISVRAPMRPDEEPVVRPYALVDDITSAVKKAEAAGAEIAIPLMEIPNRGKIAIYIQGGIEHGLWQM